MTDIAKGFKLCVVNIEMKPTISASIAVASKDMHFFLTLKMMPIPVNISILHIILVYSRNSKVSNGFTKHHFCERLSIKRSPEFVVSWIIAL